MWAIISVIIINNLKCFFDKTKEETTPFSCHCVWCKTIVFQLVDCGNMKDSVGSDWRQNRGSGFVLASTAFSPSNPINPHNKLTVLETSACVSGSGPFRSFGLAPSQSLSAGVTWPAGVRPLCSSRTSTRSCARRRARRRASASECSSPKPSFRVTPFGLVYDHSVRTFDFLWFLILQEEGGKKSDWKNRSMWWATKRKRVVKMEEILKRKG